MEDHGISAVIIPTSDFHDTEYVCDYFNARSHFSGFTGSAGTLVVLKDGGGLWTDGRYFVQAARQLEGTGIQLMKMGQESTPSIPEYIASHLKPGETAAVDGRCISAAELKEDRKLLAENGIELKADIDLVSPSWPDRPELPAAPVFLYDEKYTGESRASKLERLRTVMKEEGCSWFVTNKIDEIAWLLNIRAHDIPSFPAPLSYLAISLDGGTLYINTDRVGSSVRKALEEDGISLSEYNSIYEELPGFDGKIMMQETFVNSLMGEKAREPYWHEDPVVLMKARKNPVEQEGFRQAHLKDGAAVVRFWYWLEHAMKNETVTEISAAEKLHDFRAEQENFIEDSFETISAYGPNAAMPHYHPDEENPVVLPEKGLYLVDSGGHYWEGTTDITRTFVLGDLTEDERKYFTKVLQGHIALARAVFPKGIRGLNLDILARGPLWMEMLDYNHGTGHGVGALSNVHEAPNGFRWKVVPERNDSCELEEGMVTSDEPGFYAEDRFGIRHENLLMTQKAGSSEFGDFLKHETLTKVPFDVRGLDLTILSPDEKKWLNEYHEDVYQSLKDRIPAEEAAWLREITLPVE